MSAATARAATPFARLGGAEGIARLVRAFFAQMDARPDAAAVRVLHAADLGPMVARLASFLAGWTGGPGGGPRPFGRTVLPLAHHRFPIGPAERDAWLRCMEAALAEVGAEPDAAAELMDALRPVADACRSDAAAGPF